METMVIVTTLRELLMLHKWLVVKVAKDPKTVIPLLRIMLLGRTRNRKKKKYVRVKIDK